MANGDTNGNGLSGGFWKDMPWWVKAIAIVGVPSLISLGVVWSDRVQLADDVRSNGILLREAQASSLAHDARVVLRFEELADATAETNRILSATCVNAAQTEFERERCVGIR